MINLGRTSAALATAAVLLSAAGCCCLSHRDSGPREIRLTAEDDGRTIKLPKGSTLIVSLESNPSTGYTWDAVDPDPKVITQAGEKQWTQRPGTEGMLGAPGMMRITFKTVGAGSARLDLVYHRPWESDPPARRFGVNIQVR